jgi:hypothetical protein
MGGLERHIQPERYRRQQQKALILETETGRDPEKYLACT